MPVKSWKTTLAGLIGGLVIALGPTIGARLQGDVTAPPITSGNYLPAIAVTILGALSKDYDKTNSQTPGPTQNSDGTGPKV